MKPFWILVLFIILFLIVYNWANIRFNVMAFIILKRGFITQDCKWWNISDKFLKDASGIQLYNELKAKDEPFVKMNLFGTPLFMVFNDEYARDILDNSPYIFGVGTLKFNFFRSFMHLNVGVSEGCPWAYRRKLNEFVLSTDEPFPRYHQIYVSYLHRLLKHHPKPSNYEEFRFLSRKMAMKIVFNEEGEMPDYIFDIFAEANIFRALFVDIDLPSKPEYVEYIKRAYANPKPDSLVYLAKKFGASEKEVLHQVPHWIFPLAGLLVLASRNLVLLCNDSKDMVKARKAAYNDDYNYLRKVVMETFRLNAPVVTMFRTLLKDYNLGPYHFEKDTQFVIFTNPVLRNSKVWKDPNSFDPDRWTIPMESSNYALSFGQGPQRCPGKEMAIFLSIEFIKYILINYDIVSCEPKIDTKDVPQMINPCKVEIAYA